MYFMKKQITKSLMIVVLGLAMAFFSQCNESETALYSSVNSVGSMDEYFAQNKVNSETVTFDENVGTSFTTAKGSKVTIPGNAFVTVDGQPVTGPIVFKIKEVFSTSDMMFSGVFPISNGHVLNSGGEFYMEARAGGEKLLVKEGEMVKLVIPAQAQDPNMELFLAAGDEEPDSVNWEVPDSLGKDSAGGFGGGGFRGGFTFNSADSTYVIEMDSLGWGNIDAFDWTIQYFNCTFNLTGLQGLNNENTTAFAKFKDQNSVWPVGVRSWGDITDNVITERHLGSVPMNLVIISVVDEKLYYGLMDFTPEEGKSYSIDMKATTKEDLDKLINSFP